MASANVERARAAYEAFNRRDFDAWRELVDPDVEWHQLTPFPDRSVYRGREDMLERFIKGQLIEQFGDFTVEIDEFIDAGDHVAMIGEIVGHGTASGAGFRMRLVQILELRDGLLVRAYDLAGPPVSAHAPVEAAD